MGACCGCFSCTKQSHKCLAQGWEWADEDWKIDVAGLEEGAVDEEGWSYAVDFNWCRIPPPPGAGKFRRVRAPPAVQLDNPPAE